MSTKNLDILPRAVHLDRDICSRSETAERREWWLTNGRGGYAGGTLTGTLARGYHGLLTAVLHPPLGRVLVLAKADATLVDSEGAWPLGTNRWSDGRVTPKGDVQLDGFRLLGRMPVWRYAIGRRRIEQRIWMDRDADRVHLAWRLNDPDASAPARLDIELLVNGRDHHCVSQPDSIEPQIVAEDGALRLEYADGFRLRLVAQGGAIEPDATWIDGFHLALEEERGLQSRDAHLRAGIARLDLAPETWVGISAEAEPIETHSRHPRPLKTDLDVSMANHLERDRALLEQADRNVPELMDAPPWIRQLILAADSFLIARPIEDMADGTSVIAGYPWFGDWGRDTMIALPGLTLATGRHAIARHILATLARFIDGGLLPNCFPGAGESPAYNSVDAALWYIEGWRAYVETTDDEASLVEFYPTLAGIIDAYRRGTHHGISMDPMDGLIRAGESGLQLTWMDAKVDDWVVTPRTGKPVEVNALWYNALVAMRGFAERLGRDPAPYQELAERAANGFRRFVRPDGRGLLDLLDGPNGDDASLRPNQVFAVSLTASPLTPTERSTVVEICERLLLTPYGLRSLAPDDTRYRGRYLGNVRERDGAYHQGSVWCWLLGHFALAQYRVTGDAERALALLEPLADHLSDAGLGSLGELFDGDPPHAPRGTPLQAWSVACTLEAWWRLAPRR
ncbi:Amylo-alpha-16-glucosidase [Thiorhodococcus drewsii AZ1]|uniref:Amylo-alpha-16-glucosidase n=1 Tax=Thiorhodococcus drewsii AZ1 TaxID=765913 RepID=G2E636_9GAMM|nr:amylo-alpha-1,6-glucosidase [Thiorhodococcus drewsii]EGV28453.1 Amylo-alpha-16-glucosidase [Thiorhodococcus drewsii AZ1]